MSVERTETFRESPAAAYRGTFAPDEPVPVAGEDLPPAWEGVYFPFAVDLADLRPDGTPARDGVLPEIDLPRRMYAGEDTEFFAPLRIGDAVTQKTSLGSVVKKHGRSGPLVFVDVVRDYVVDGKVVVRSTWHDVFLGLPDPEAPVRPPRTDSSDVAESEWTEDVRLDARQLFRFSALTFNTHLVHYDRAWAREVEHLDDLLVHGPLTRILLMDAARRHGAGLRPRILSVQSTAPIYVDTRVRLCGRTLENGATRVAAVSDDGASLASATITWA